MKRLIIAVFVFGLVLSPSVLAKELPKAAKYENVTWYIVNHTKFKPGKVDEGLKIIYEHFVPTDRAIGRDVITFEPLTGDWDHMVFFPMEDGASGIGWKVTPKGEKWWAEMAKRLGGAEKAQDLWARFNELVAERKSEIVMRRLESIQKEGK